MYNIHNYLQCLLSSFRALSCQHTLRVFLQQSMEQPYSIFSREQKLTSQVEVIAAAEHKICCTKIQQIIIKIKQTANKLPIV